MEDGCSTHVILMNVALNFSNHAQCHENFVLSCNPKTLWVESFSYFGSKSDFCRHCFISNTICMAFVLQDGRVCRLPFSINPDKIESGKPEPRDKRYVAKQQCSGLGVGVGGLSSSVRSPVLLESPNEMTIVQESIENCHFESWSAPPCRPLILKSLASPLWQNLWVS